MIRPMREILIYSPESCYIYYYLCGVLIRFKVVFNYNPQAW